MELNLTPWQRVMILNILANIQGDLRVRRKVIKLLDIFEFTTEEELEINLAATESGYAWKETDLTYSFKIGDDSLAALLVTCLTAYEQWPVHPMDQINNLLAQVGIEE